MDHHDAQPPGTIRVFLADDNLIVREGVRALIDRQAGVQVVGVAADYDEAVSGATAANPQVLVTDIRMPPAFQREGIDAAKEVRKRHPGDGDRGAVAVRRLRVHGLPACRGLDRPTPVPLTTAHSGWGGYV
jgi:CheY-like chemotaxis protein